MNSFSKYCLPVLIGSILFFSVEANAQSSCDQNSQCLSDDFSAAYLASLVNKEISDLKSKPGSIGREWVNEAIEFMMNLRKTVKNGQQYLSFENIENILKANDVDRYDLSRLLLKAVSIYPDPSLGDFGNRCFALQSKIESLINIGADVNESDYEGKTPLMLARSLEVKKILIDAGADVNAKDCEGRTELHFCDWFGAFDECAFLIKAGADVNVRDAKGITPLMMRGTTEVIRLLIDAGADVKARSVDGSTVLHFHRCADCCKILIDAGADVNAKDNEGKTPLHSIIKRGSYCSSEIELFIHEGADVNAMDSKGKTPIMYVIECLFLDRCPFYLRSFLSDQSKEYIKMASILLAAGAKIPKSLLPKIEEFCSETGEEIVIKPEQVVEG